jgi:hypothetical protein
VSFTPDSKWYVSDSTVEALKVEIISAAAANRPAPGMAFDFGTEQFDLADDDDGVLRLRAKPGDDLETQLRRIALQRLVCASVGEPWDPPAAADFILADDGVWAGDPFQAVRYPTTQSSGWFITTDRYTGPTDLHNHHAAHTAQLGNIYAYLALPVGSRFYSDGTFEFDREVASAVRD